jgi:hypothetical protein
MAELKRQTLGDATGKVGHVVFKIKGNKNLICKDPVRAKLPTEDMLARRAKFKLTCQVAKAIYGAGVLKLIWPKPGTNKGTRFSEMFKKNYPVNGSPDAIGSAEVIPDNGVIMQNPAIVLTQAGMTITADQFASTANIDPNIEKFLIAEGIVILTTPTKDTDLPYRILPISTGRQSLNTDQPINISFEFFGSQASIYKGYTDKKVYLTFLTLNNSGEPVTFTDSFNN